MRVVEGFIYEILIVYLINASFCIVFDVII